MKTQQSISAPWFFEESHIIDQLETSKNGLTIGQVEERRKQFGPNSIDSKKNIHVLSILSNQFTSPLIFILIIAAVLTGFLKEWIDMIVILFAIGVNTGLGFYQEYQAETTLATLTSYVKERARVFRDNHEKEIDSSELVPGDKILLQYGSRVPADVRIIEVNNLRIDEAILTGESLAITKQTEPLQESTVIAERTNMAHAGTLIIDGFGVGIVISTGNNTELGKIAALVAKTQRSKTPLQKGVARLAWFITGILSVIIIGIFMLGISNGVPVFEMLLLSIAVAVGAVPEALPIALTVILSVGAFTIAQKKGVIRKLASAETLGSATLIMTDKTGTLTQADMQLVGVYPAEDIINRNHKDLPALEKGSNLSQNAVTLLQDALHSISVITTKDTNDNMLFDGRPFEKNIAKTAHEHNIDISVLTTEKKYIVIPFNSTHKFSVARAEKHFVVMGAPDILIARSGMSKHDQETLLSWMQIKSEEGYRLLAIGNIPLQHNIETTKDVQNIHIKGILAFHDPIRPEVPHAIQSIQERGVKVIMVTGDLPGTAMAIGKSLGWDITHDHILTGTDIQSASDETLLSLLPSIKIFARVTPEDKLRIGLLYQQLGETVAMTGDGVNDAPALKAMDIGISLGSASDVAKSAADLVLLDDNFETITSTITEGRRILANIQKTFVYLLSNSLDSVFVVAGSLLVGIPIPLTALQIIWVNLFTGSFPALAFAFDENIESKKTLAIRHKTHDIFSKESKYLALGIGTFTSFLLFILYYALLQYGIDTTVARSIFFVCFATYILVAGFSFRSLQRPIFSYNPFSNKRLNYSVLLAIALIISTITIPFFQSIFDIQTFPLKYMWIIMLWIIGNVVLVELGKWWFQHTIHTKIQKRTLI
jgi:Ca2+-transporting ATPase